MSKGNSGLTRSSDRMLFTPGPLTTSLSVKQAMLHDLGSRDSQFISLTQSIRKRLLSLSEVGSDYTSILMQGSGTFGVESVLGTVIPKTGKVLIISNGAYGTRMAQIVKILGIEHEVLSYAEDQSPRPNEIRDVLSLNKTDKSNRFTHVAMVHCETTSGIFNPIETVGEICKQFGVSYIVDAMSSFGAVPIDLKLCSIDYLISSPNKCIEGVPGISFVIAKRALIEKSEGQARSLSLDLHSQWHALETQGEFRYTPPIQVLLAFEQALNELDQEGGIENRSKRYQENHLALVEGMGQLGFKTYLSGGDLGFIITSFHYLKHPQFQYKIFYEKLQERGFVIYSGKVSNADCFRIGNIGRVFKSDVLNLLSAIRETLQEMQILT